jgi:methyltransferase (TIGR00027 family)
LAYHLSKFFPASSKATPFLAGPGHWSAEALRLGAALAKRIPFQVAAMLAILAVNAAVAVEPGQPSKTSIMAAARRALAAHDYDPTVRNPDWLAERFLGPLERKILANDPSITALSMDYRDAQKLQPESVGMQLIRTRFIDERLERAVQGSAVQVVVLGAGFDSRAYRLRNLLRDVRVFEVDYGPTQAYKKLRIQEIFGSLPKNVTYVPIDFTRQKLSKELAKAGYAKGRKTFFIWEGVTYYIPEEAIRETLRYVSETAPGSAIVFDAKKKSFVDWVKANMESPDRVAEALRPVLAQQKKYMEWGEPWIFGFPDGKEDEFLQSVGLELSELLPQDGDEVKRRYQTRRDGTLAFPILPVQPGVPTSAAAMVEAVVPPR